MNFGFMLTDVASSTFVFCMMCSKYPKYLQFRCPKMAHNPLLPPLLLPQPSTHLKQPQNKHLYTFTNPFTLSHFMHLDRSYCCLIGYATHNPFILGNINASPHIRYKSDLLLPCYMQTKFTLLLMAASEIFHLRV